jgi:hypothetical protein
VDCSGALDECDHSRAALAFAAGSCPTWRCGDCAANGVPPCCGEGDACGACRSGAACFMSEESLCVALGYAFQPATLCQM